jgi:hypothetical protein
VLPLTWRNKLLLLLLLEECSCCVAPVCAALVVLREFILCSSCGSALDKLDMQRWALCSACRVLLLLLLFWLRVRATHDLQSGGIEHTQTHSTFA